MENKTRRWLTEKQLCEYLDGTVSVFTIQHWRSAKTGGPPFVRVGRNIRYRVDQVDAWLNSRTVEPVTA